MRRFGKFGIILAAGISLLAAACGGSSGGGSKSSGGTAAKGTVTISN
jgi:hypothetical protein